MDEAKVADLIAAASRVVQAAELPDDLRAAAFTKAMDLLAGDTAVKTDTPSRSSPSDSGATAGTDKVKAATTGSLDTAAMQIGVDRAALDAVVGIDDGQPIIHIAPSKLEAKPRPAMRQLIHVLTAVRQGGAWDDITDGEVIKKHIAAHYKNRYDPNNFWNAVNGLSDSIRNTNGKLKMLPDGYRSASTLINELAGVSQKPK